MKLKKALAMDYIDSLIIEGEPPISIQFEAGVYDGFQAGFEAAKKLAMRDLHRVTNDDSAASIVYKTGEEEV